MDLELESATPGTPVAEGDDRPLSHGQRALWFLHRAAPASSAYTIAGAGRVTPPCDVVALRRAFELLVERHPLLRSVFVQQAHGPVRRVLPATGAGAPAFLESIDASGWSEEELPERVSDLAFRPFDLEAGPLFRVSLIDRTDRTDGTGGGEDAVVLVSLHHLVGDLWSLAVVIRELGIAYTALARGEDPRAALGPAPAPYDDWVEEERRRLDGPEGEAERRFWEERLEGPEGPFPPLDLATDRPRPPVQGFRGAVESRPLGAGLRRSLGALGRAHGTNRFTVLLAAFQALLYRHCGQEAYLVGSPTSGRTGSRAGSASSLAGVVGYFVNPVAIRADLAGDPTFDELIERVRGEAAGALEHQSYPFPLLAERLQTERDPSRPPLFQVLLVLQKSPVPGMRGLPAFALGRAGAPLELGGLRMESVPFPQRGSQFDLSLFVTEEGGELVGSLEYDGDLFDPETARALLDRLAVLLEAAAADPGGRVSELPILPDAERRTLLGEWAAGEGRPEAPEPEGALLHELFAAQAAATPGAEALVAGEERLTYGELDRRSRVLAARLAEAGAGPDVPIGVFLERSADLVVAILGVLRAGAAYVPMDPAYPAERIELMIDDSRMPAVVTGGEAAGRLPGTLAARGVRVVDAEAPAEGEEAPAPAPSATTPDHLAYLIYTSGSTGRPKGVAITHRNASAMLAWAGVEFSPRELSGVLASTSVCFDLSVFEIFAPLVRGGRVILVDNALALPSLSAAGEVTLINTVPSAIAELCQAGALPPSVESVNLAGEPLRRRLVEAVYAAGAVARVRNLYGPSEDTTYSTVAACPADEAREPTIGRVIPGSRGYVADRGLRATPPGAAGELVLAGAGLARGYLGRPALTAERFVPDPFATGSTGFTVSTGFGGRLYRTGDRVRHLRDGRLEFLGRLDHQVKLRGFRIELGEIETALQELDGIDEAVALVRDDGSGPRLVAYLVAAGGAPAAPPAPQVGELRSALGRRLPGYMVPELFVELAGLPRTPNGKVDRKALPAPGADRPALTREYVAPETAVEQILAEIWSDVLGVERVGIQDSFFELGGHSLKATQVLLRVRETFGVDLPVHRLFSDPTVSGLAVAIAEALMAEAGEDVVAEILEGGE